MNSSSVKSLQEMGFSVEMIDKAYKIATHEKKGVLDVLLTMQQTSPQPIIQNPLDLEPFTPDQRVRLGNFPVGLKNVGNTCYLNSLLQMLFFVPSFFKEIISFVPENISQPSRKIQICQKLAYSLKKTFTELTLSAKKYVNPSELVGNLIDDFGNNILIGEQKDASEMYLNLIARIEDAFCKKMVIDERRSFAKSSTKKMNKKDEEYCIIGSSLKVRTEERNAGFIPKNFFGKMKEKITYKEKNNFVCKEEEIVFGPIILDIEPKELYSSCEQFLNCDIENFKNEEGNVVPAKQSLKIQEAPTILFFQLQRVKYQKDGLIKNNQKFTFEKEIYLDRFLLKNEEICNKNKDMDNFLSNKIREIEKELEVLKNYKNSKIVITDILNLASEFMKEAENNNIVNDKDELEDFDLLEFNIDDNDNIDINHKKSYKDDKALQDCVETLTSMKTSWERKIKKKEDELAKLKKEKINLYKDLNQEKYHLLGTIIHEGVMAEQGHYFTYIFNRFNKKWYKFSDIFVNEITKEEEIFENAYGNGNRSAYCMMYVHEKMFDIDGVLYEDILDIGESTVPICDIYEKYKKHIPEHLAQDCLKENQRFKQEVQRYIETSVATTIFEDYTERYCYLEERFAEYSISINQKKIAPPFLLNFSGFLLYLNRQLGFSDQFYKWHLFDCSIREKMPELTLFTLEKNTKLFTKIKEDFFNVVDPFRIHRLILDKSEKDVIENKFSLFLEVRELAEQAILMMKEFVSHNWLNCIKISFDIAEKKAGANGDMVTNYFFLMASQVFKIVCLWLTHKCYNILENNEEDKFEANLFFLSYFLNKALNLDKKVELVKKQCMEMICNYCEQFKNKGKLSDKLKITCKAFLNDEITNIENKKKYFELLTKQLEFKFDPDIFLWRKGRDRNINKEFKNLFDQISKLKEINMYHDLTNNQKILKQTEREKLGIK